MYKNQKIGVVVPAYNEEKFIGAVIDTMPPFVDCIYAVNDASSDTTSAIINDRERGGKRVRAIHRKTRGGVGAAILSGHRQALKDGMNIVAVMAGDGQMDPAILEQFIRPIAEGQADYVKGNRLSLQNIREMPVWRRFGNSVLTNLTRVSSGYWHISDPQNGYTAISAKTLKRLDLDKIEIGFAFENDMLVKLNVAGARVMDIQHPAIYRGQRSKIRYSRFITNTSWILLKDCGWRIWMKYIRLRSSRELKSAN